MLGECLPFFQRRVVPLNVRNHSPSSTFDIKEGLNPQYKSTGKMWLAKSSQDRGPTLKMIFLCEHAHSCTCMCTHTLLYHKQEGCIQVF